MTTITTDTHDGTSDDMPDIPTDPVYLDAPATGLKDTWRHAGPGLAAAMTGVGGSHIMHAPTAGAQFGYALLWVIPFAYLLKYCAYEFAHRYTVVKGESIMEAFGRVGQWPFWYLIFSSFSTTFGLAGGALGCAALIWAAFPVLSLELWTVAVLISIVAILWVGRYAALERVMKASVLIFTITTAIAFALQAPPPGEYLSRLLPSLPPAAGLMLFGAMWGFFPTTVEVAPMQSNWTVDKKAGMVRVRELQAQGVEVRMHPDYMKNWLTIYRRDMNVSYIVAMLAGMVFLIIGAVVLRPLGDVPAGREMGQTLARIYTQTFGPWAFPVIIAGALAALYSTMLAYFDGQARVFEESCVRLRRSWDRPGTRRHLYRGMQVLWILGGTAIAFGMPRPIFVIQIASVLALVFSPVIYWLIVKAVKDGFTTEWERTLLPGPALMALARVGIACLTLISGYVIFGMFFL